MYYIYTIIMFYKAIYYIITNYKRGFWRFRINKIKKQVAEEEDDDEMMMIKKIHLKKVNKYFLTI